MFERNRVDNRPERGAVPVELGLQDGTEAKGKLIMPAGHAPLDALNGPGGFVEFEPYGGEPRFIAKSTIATLRPVGVPRTPRLDPKGTAGDEFDPHAILGLSADCAWEDVRQAYVRLSKTYHPDVYSSTLLPPEVKVYLEAMARRVNAAYAALEATKAAWRARAAASQPVFTSQPRA